MFQLIVAVISIALIAALAGASIFYGGSAFSGSTAKANVTSLINQAQQIAGAGSLFATDHAGAKPTNIATDLVANSYLQAAPTPSSIASAGAWDITDDGKLAFVAINDEAVVAACAEVAKQNGNQAQVVDATFDATSTTVVTGQFNCVVDAATPTAGFFVFKM